jgi:ADP-ribosyl-[dinitrogen reductase] hydrolase
MFVESTHHNGEAYVGALAVVIAIRFILSGVWSHENSLLVAVADSVPDSAVRDRINQFLALTLPPSEVASQFGASDGWWTPCL